MSKSQGIKKSGITLVEVIIAIVIFGVGILSILKILGNNILIIQHTKLKTQATMLAKEGIEIMYNLRDSNVDRSFERNCIKLVPTQVWVTIPWWDGVQETIQASSYDCAPWAYIQWSKSYLVWYDQNAHYQIMEQEQNDGRLYYNSNAILTHQVSEKPSPFRRIINIIPIATDMNYSSGDLIYQVTSTVSYKSNSSSGHVSLQSFIGLTR